MKKHWSPPFTSTLLAPTSASQSGAGRGSQYGSGHVSGPGGVQSPSLIMSAVWQRSFSELSVVLENLRRLIERAAPVNLVANPGFESGRLSFDPWHVRKNGNGGKWTVSTTNPRTGANCVQFDPDGQSGNALLDANGVIDDTTAHPFIDEDAVLFVSGWFRTVSGSGNGQAFLRITWLDEGGAEISTRDSTTVNVTTTYQRIAFYAEAPAGTVHAAVSILFGTIVSPPTYLIDDIDAFVVTDRDRLDETAYQVSRAVATGTSGTWQMSATETVLLETPTAAHDVRLPLISDAYATPERDGVSRAESRIYTIRNIAGTGALTLKPHSTDSSANVDGGASYNIAANASVSVVSDGSHWWVIGT